MNYISIKVLKRLSVSGFYFRPSPLLHKAVLPPQDVLDKCIAVIRATVPMTQQREEFMTEKANLVRLWKSVDLSSNQHSLEQLWTA